jgi:positive regulator of sigma E activity
MTLTNKLLATILSALYVITATLYTIAIARDLESSVLSSFLEYFFAPVTFFVWWILFTERNPNNLILVADVLIHPAIWLIAYMLLELFRKQKR